MRSTIVLSFAVALLLQAAALAQDDAHPAAGLPVPRSHLSADDARLAAEIGAPGRAPMGVFALRDKSRSPNTVLSDVQAVDDGDPARRLAIVTLYDYDSNLSIRRLVDLENEQIVDEQVMEGSSAPLADVEKDLAEALVRDNPQITELLGPTLEDAEVEVLLTASAGPDDEFAGKRVVLTTLRTTQGYPENVPKIFVNLTDSVVILRD